MKQFTQRPVIQQIQGQACIFENDVPVRKKNHTNLVFQKAPELGCGKTKGMA
jgi:hypothetical protein